MQVFKFGGASVKDADAVRNVVSILKKYATSPTLVVISAMGKSTNKLEELVKAYYYKEGDAQKIIGELRDFHYNILNQLYAQPDAAITNEIENVFAEINWAIEEEISGSYNYHYDQIVSQGEVLATKIVNAYLNQEKVNSIWVDARSFIQTDNSYREGKVDYALSETLVKKELLFLEIERANASKRKGAIGFAVQDYCERKNTYKCVRELVGHGIGRTLHEDPQVPN